MADLFDIPSDLSVPNSSPTPDDLAAVIFNEHRSAHGPDPTHGPLYWRHQAVDPHWNPEFAKDWFATEKFENKPLAHSFGPFQNSAPSPKRPMGYPIYLNIYGDEPWGDESRDE